MPIFTKNNKKNIINTYIKIKLRYNLNQFMNKK